MVSKGLISTSQATDYEWHDVQRLRRQANQKQRRAQHGDGHRRRTDKGCLHRKINNGTASAIIKRRYSTLLPFEQTRYAIVDSACKMVKSIARA